MSQTNKDRLIGLIDQIEHRLDLVSSKEYTGALKPYVPPDSSKFRQNLLPIVVVMTKLENCVNILNTVVDINDDNCPKHLGEVTQKIVASTGNSSGDSSKQVR